MQALQHEHLVPCLDAGESGRYHYLVMPYVRGGTLEDMLDGSSLTLKEVCIILEQLTSAVAYTHALGLLHRDIKPSKMCCTPFKRHSKLRLSSLNSDRTSKKYARSQRSSGVDNRL